MILDDLFCDHDHSCDGSTNLLPTGSFVELIAPMCWLFNDLITAILLWLAMQLINGFTFKNGISGALSTAIPVGSP